MVNAAAALIIYRNKFLLGKRKAGEYTDKWEFPKGIIEEKETAFQALQRAVKHHFGIDIFPYQSIKRFRYQSAQKKGELVLVKCSILSRWQDVTPDKSLYADFLWMYIFNTDKLDFAPVDQKIISFLLFDTTILPQKTRSPGQKQSPSPRIKNRGFASMTITRRKLIAGLGGKAAHAQGKAHTYTSEEARRVGRIGGRGRQRKYVQPLAPLADSKIAQMYKRYMEKQVTITEICREYKLSRTMLYKYFQKYSKGAEH